MAALISNKIKEKASGIELVVFDVDGVLTDGSLLYGENGEQLKRFNVKDGVGIKLLQCFDITVAVISAKQSAALDVRLKDLGIAHRYTGCKDKLTALDGLLVTLGLTYDQVAYCGDDVIDLKVMKNVGLAIAPADAYKMVRDYAHVCTEAAGGKGVAREVADLILATKMDLETAYIKAMLPEFEDSTLTVRNK